MRNTATVLRLPTGQPQKIDDGLKTIALVQREIFRSGWSYIRLATAAGVGEHTVMNIARGETKRPTLRTIILILTALGWDVYASERR